MSNQNRENGAGFEPCNDKHSIKETSLIFLLDRPFPEIEAFASQLSENEAFSKKIQKIGNPNIKPSNDPSQVKQEQKKIGFVIQDKFDNSVICANEDSRNFLSYKTTSYSRWDEFKPKAFRSLNELSGFLPGRYFQIFALEYIDEFRWKGSPNDLSLGLLFNSEGKVFPSSFLDNNTTSFQVVRQTKNDPSSMVYEEIQIWISPEPSVLVRHHVTGSLEKSIFFSELESLESFNVLLNEIHGYNKDRLTELLLPEMLERIGIKPKKN